MQISLTWLNELVDLQKTNLDELIEKLTLGGFEVEEIIERDINSTKQTILDISTTANRADSLSIMAMAQEIAMLLDKPIKIPKYFQDDTKFQTFQKKFDSDLTNGSQDSNCSTFIGIILENLNTQTSPKWLQEKLLSSDIVVNNNLSDFQNYLLLEMGYHFEFYDYDKICQDLKTDDFTLSVKPANSSHQLIAINDSCYSLDHSILTIQANESLLGIAGLIQSKKYMVSDTTVNILVECSIFNAAKIRQQSRKLGLRTERSARYEKSITKTYLLDSFYRLVQLLKVSNSNLNLKIHTSYSLKSSVSDPILLYQKTINEVLGPINQANQKFINSEQISNYLNRLKFKFDYNKNGKSWKIQVPSSRQDDIKREIDLVEEIGRLHGFNNFVTTLPKLKMIGKEDSTYKLRKKITTSLINLGFSELISYSLVKNNNPIEDTINLVNPLLVDYASLRTSMLPSLLDTTQKNLKQKNIPLANFEYGHLFHTEKGQTFVEKEFVAGIFGGYKSKLAWDIPETSLAWFEAKAKIDQLFKQLNLNVSWKSVTDPKSIPILHPYRSAEVYLKTGIKVGIFGQINPLTANQLNLSTDFYLFEFDLEIIKQKSQDNKLIFYKPYVLYPKIIKNLSFVLEKEISFDQVQQILYLNGTKFLTNINLIEEYNGESIPSGYKSFCIELTFQSSEGTLENKKIETIIQNLELTLTNKLEATFRN